MPIQADAEIEIHAPIDEVWRAMVDFEHYGDWNPFIVHVDATGVPSRVGDKMTLHVQWVDDTEGTVKSGEEITVYTPPQAGVDAELAYRFTGWMHTLGLVRATRVQHLTTLPNGATRYSTAEVFRGLLATAVPLERVQAGFAAHAEALKAHCEGRTSATPVSGTDPSSAAD